MIHVRLFPSFIDTVLQHVVDKIPDSPRVANASGTVPPIHAALAGKPPALGVDLIAHSRSELLRFDAWTIDVNPEMQAVQQALAGALNGVALEIRLLGCNTGLNPSGRPALTRLAALFNARVWGTTAPISAVDFNNNGFQSTGLLIDNQGNPFPGALQAPPNWFGTLQSLPQAVKLTDVFGILRPESATEIGVDWNRTHKALRWPFYLCELADLHKLVLDHADPRPAENAPGLLALPDLELIAPTPSGQGFVRATILIDKAFIRVLPRNSPHGALLKMDMTQKYSDALDALIRRSRPFTPS